MIKNRPQLLDLILVICICGFTEYLQPDLRSDSRCANEGSELFTQRLIRTLKKRNEPRSFNALSFDQNVKLNVKLSGKRYLDLFL